MTEAKPPAQDVAGSQAAGLLPDDGARLLELFEAVIDLPPDAREARIDALCGDRLDLAQALRALIERDARTGPLDRDLAGSLQPLLHEALPALERTPERIGAYQILRLLGEGGMGRVYLARRVDSPVEHTVALKLMRPDRVAPGLLARFEAERQHLAALDHPGICRFIDAGALDDGSPYVVMEAVEGEPLLAYAQRRGLDLRARVELLRLLLAAVAHAHDRLRVHRDIKPQNVLVNAEGQPKLLDFGIAKSIEDERASVTRTAERFFTPNASAPEQLLGQTSGVACDVYGLGALAYELLSGALPFDFEGLRAAEIERLILQVAPPLMSERSSQPWARELRGDLDAIIATCLRKSPAERYRNVLALDAELQRWLEGRPVAARAPSWAYRARLFARRHRSAVALSAALALAILGSASALAYQALQLREQRNLALVERDRALKVVEILESAFRNADPAQAAGDTVTARQILDAAVPAIDALEEEQPALFARLASTLAKVELDLIQSARAESWVLRGLAAHDRIASNDADAIQLLLTGTLMHARAGRHEPAEELLARLERTEHGRPYEVAFVKARLLYARAEYAAAVELAAATLSGLPTTLNHPREQITRELRNLHALATFRAGQAQEALSLFRALLSWQQEELPPHHAWVLSTRNNILRVRTQAEPEADLSEDFQALLADAIAFQGEESALAANTRSMLVDFMTKAGRTREANAQLELAYASLIRARGAHHADTLRVGIGLGRKLIDEGSSTSLERAVEVLEECYRHTKQQFVPTAAITLVAQRYLANAYEAQGLTTDLLRVLADPHFNQIHTARNLGELGRSLKQLARAKASDACSTPSNPQQTSTMCEEIARRVDEIQRRMESQANANQAQH